MKSNTLIRIAKAFSAISTTTGFLNKYTVGVLRKSRTIDQFVIARQNSKNRHRLLKKVLFPSRYLEFYKKRRRFKTMNDGSRNSIQSPNAPARPTKSQLSKRARLVDLYNTTKSSYIPSIANSISSLVNSNDDGYSVPHNAKIFMYKTYTVANEEDYNVNVHGYLYCPGTMTRKNRLLLTLARQLAKSSSNQSTMSSQRIAEQFEGEIGDKLNNPDEYKYPDMSTEDSESVYSSLSSVSSGISATSEAILKERLEGFMTRSLPNVILRIVVGSESKIPVEELTKQEVITDDNGHFKVQLTLRYKPSVVQVSSVINEELVAFNEVNIIENSHGVSIISDIDDTVKLTGVVNDKRDMFRNVFTKKAKDLEIPGFANWFNLAESKGCKVHYVSNSPWQLLKPIKNFFDLVDLPYDSIHLKQYSGNVIALLMEPSSERKKSTLMRIVADFPNRKFVMVGDTGERDLELYLTIAKMFPDQILKIYMRVVPGSLSDTRDDYVYKQIMKLMALRDSKSPDVDLIDLNSDIPNKVTTTTTKIKMKLSPIIPRKPTALKGNSIVVDADLEVLPKLPKRRTQTFTTTSELKHTHDLPPRAATGTDFDSINMSNSSSSMSSKLDSASLAPNGLYNFSNVMPGLDSEDKRGDLWRERTVRVMNELPEQIGITFFKDVDEVIEESLIVINQHQR